MTTRTRSRTPRKPSFVEFATAPSMLGLPFSEYQTALGKVTFGEELSPREAAVYRECTGGGEAYTPAPGGPLLMSVRAGAAGGKTNYIGAPMALYAALFGYRTVPGEQQPCIALMSVDHESVKGTTFESVVKYCTDVPFVRSQVESVGVKEVRFRNGMVIKTFPRTSNALQGYSVVLFVGDEFGHWPSEPKEGSAEEIAAVVSRAQARQMRVRPKALWITTPRGPSGLCWDHNQQFWGKPSEYGVHFHATTAQLNPAHDRAVVAALRASDPSRARRYYDAEFSAAAESMLDESWIRVMADEHGPLPLDLRFQHVVGFDMSGGRFDEAVASAVRREVWLHPGERVEIIHRHVEQRVWTPRPGQPWSAEAIYRATAEMARKYRTKLVVGNLFGGEGNLSGAFKAALPGYEIEYRRPAYRDFTPSTTTVSAAGHASISPARSGSLEQPKSRIFEFCVPLFASGQVVLLDNASLLHQAKTEERVTTGEVDKFDHPRGGHDDRLTAVLSAVFEAAQGRARPLRAEVDGQPMGATGTSSATAPSEQAGRPGAGLGGGPGRASAAAFASPHYPQYGMSAGQGLAWRSRRRRPLFRPTRTERQRDPFAYDEEKKP